MSYLNGIYALIKNRFPSQEGGYVSEEPHQGLPDSPYMDNAVNQENTEKAVDTYDQFVGTEVCVPDEQGIK